MARPSRIIDVRRTDRRDALIRLGDYGSRLLSSAMLGVVSLLFGCAVMSESECLVADWHAVGERDGSDGRPLAHLSKYYEACAQYGVFPDEEAYSQGRELGLTRYCTEDRGYQEGRIGTGYRGVCPMGLEPYFLDGYNAGIAVRRTIEEVHHVDYRIHSTREEIDDLKEEIAELESPEDDDASTGKDKPSADRLKDMYRELGRLEAELENLQDEKVYAIVAYRRAVDFARSMGFYEQYEY